MPGQPVVLDTFGGIVATARPEDLPEGASPRNNDVDFVVGRFIQRPGCQSAYEIVSSAYGPENGTVATDVDTESFPWTNPNNILLDDGTYTTISLLGQSGVASVNVTGGGYYAPSETVTVAFSGTGSGAAGTAITTTVTPPAGPTYKKVIGVTVSAPGTYTGPVTVAFTGAADPSNNATGIVVPSVIGQTSDNLRVTGFDFAVQSNYVIRGIVLNVKGFAPNATIYAQLVKGGANVGDIKSAVLPTTDGVVSLGSETDLWGSTWNSDDVDAPNFGLELWVSSASASAVSLDSAQLLVYGVPPLANFNGIVNANLNQTDQVTLALDANGLTWEEDVTNAPGQLALQAGIPAAMVGAYLKGLDANGIAYMAYSDLTQGVSQPMQYTGSWCDRITQVGPGVAPTFTPIQSTSDTYAITNITQPAQKSDPADPGYINTLQQSAGPSSTAPGNVITVFYANSLHYPQDSDLVNAFNSGNAVYVYVSGTSLPAANGTFLVTSIGNAIPPGGAYYRWYFTYQVNSTAYQQYGGPDDSPGYYQRTLATLTTSVPVPGLVVGNQVTISGNSVAGYNTTWTITQAINSGEMVITATKVVSGVATYSYSVASGANPAAGELVTVTNTTNANGALNVTNATIVSSTGGSTGTFTINTTLSVDYATAVESGTAVTAGTVFAFDPGQVYAGTSTNPIYGTGTGGTLTFSGASAQYITAGTKQGSVFFITRNGAVTRPAPPVTFTIPTNTSSIRADLIPLGPPNVIARGITFTESGQNGVKGANFYYYDTPVSYTVNGIAYTSDALIIPDNTTTTATFTFSDTVLLASDEIDIPGNNYFNLIELGNPAWMFQYASRMMYGLCQTKIQNLLNMSFDGGYHPTRSTAWPMPAGWSATTSGNVASYTLTAFSITSNELTVTAVNSLTPGANVILSGLTTGTYLNGVPLVVDTASGTQFTASFSHADVATTTDSGTVSITDSSIGLVQSLDFGNAFRMVNLGTSAWTNAAVLFQPAYQDYLGVNVIQPNTAYSVRVKARSIGQNGQLVTIQLPTYNGESFGPTLYGTASFSFNQGGYQIQTGVLIPGNGLATVPPALVLAVGIGSLAVNAGVEIDRIEIFPTNRPVDTITVWTSYAGKFESVDIVSGSLGVGSENPQPATGAFEILEQLYIQKTKSVVVTQDSPNYEPNDWNTRQASDRAGAIGPNAFDEGEEFAVLATRNGVYYFDGGKPMPILRELQSTAKGLNLWEYVNWEAGSKIWIRNDLNNRRLMIGLPLNTPNPWLPLAPALVPASPNVILMCNYTGCPTGPELEESSEVHVTMFGDLKALDMRRKWSIWQIPCPVAEFVPRADTFTDPLFLCNGADTSKIYQLVPGAAVGGQNTDDGAAINWSYATYGFTKAKQGQQTPGLGALRKIWFYLAATMEGIGQVAGKLYSNSLGALPQNTFTIPLPFTLSSPQQRDQERVLEIGGQRLFVEFSSLGSGGYAEIGPVMLDGEADKVSPHTGRSS